MDNDIVVIMPTVGRPELLQQSVQTFIDTSKNAEIFVISDNEPLPVSLGGDRVRTTITEDRLGFWSVLNVGLGLTDQPIVGFFGNDVVFHDGWEDAVEDCFSGRREDGKLLVAVRDDVWDSYHASHGFIGRSLLEVFYGMPQFPSEYFHAFADSELTQFAKDLGRFHYCEAAYIKHLHHTKGGREVDWVDRLPKGFSRAKRIYDRRYKEWDSGGRNEARKRL